ncbi:MAG: ribonuclease H-like domain-containing protein, partial [Arenimonas sp.]
MNALAEQLARLRQQAGQRAAGGRALPGAELGQALERARSPLPEELRRLLGIRLRAQATPLRSVDRELPGMEIAEGLRLVEARYRGCAAPQWLDVDPVVSRREAPLGAIACTRLLHFDTETTGLAGGTGTRAFMIGAADWDGDGLRVRQLLCTQMRGERAMLECFASWLQPDTVLSSYNGRCYDAPLLAARYRLSRLDNPLHGLRHVDLLFPVRRRFRGVWENCRLATAERNWLDIAREDDLPGSEAPRAWLDYLRAGSAR